jgi:hypothetical protein
MGNSTQGFFNSNIKMDQIEEVINRKFNVPILFKRIENEDYDYNVIRFYYNNEPRMLSVFENYKDKSHTGQDIVTLVDLDAWGSSVELIKGIVEEFGGYMVNNSGYNDWKPVEKVNKNLK